LTVKLYIVLVVTSYQSVFLYQQIESEMLNDVAP
jgi:hypothetical protein